MSLELLKGKTVVGGDCERVVSSEMVAQKIQRFLVEFDPLVYLFLLAVVFKQNLEGTDGV